MNTPQNLQVRRSTDQSYGPSFDVLIDGRIARKLARDEALGAVAAFIYAPDSLPPWLKTVEMDDVTAGTAVDPRDLIDVEMGSTEPSGDPPTADVALPDIELIDLDGEPARFYYSEDGPNLLFRGKPVRISAIDTLQAEKLALVRADYTSTLGSDVSAWIHARYLVPVASGEESKPTDTPIPDIYKTEDFSDPPRFYYSETGPNVNIRGLSVLIKQVNHSHVTKIQVQIAPYQDVFSGYCAWTDPEHLKPIANRPPRGDDTKIDKDDEPPRFFYSSMGRIFKIRGFSVRILNVDKWFGSRRV